MADLSHRGDITAHPDVHEMRARYARMLRDREPVVVDGAVLLVGLYCAISPWVVHFSAARPDLTVNNLVLGLAIACIGLGFTAGRAGLRWTMAAMGVWLIISPWVVTRGPDAGMIWNNLIVGVLTCLFGLAAMGGLAKGTRAET